MFRFILYSIFVLVLVCYSKIASCDQQRARIGDPCTSSNGKKGICLLQPECTKLDHTARTEYFDTCHLNTDGTPVVCCTPTKSTTNVDNSARAQKSSSSTEYNPANKKWSKNKPNDYYQTAKNSESAQKIYTQDTQRFVVNTFDLDVSTTTKAKGIENRNIFHNGGRGQVTRVDNDWNKGPRNTLNRVDVDDDQVKFPDQSGSGRPVWSSYGQTTRRPRTEKPAQETIDRPKRMHEQKCEEYSKIITSTVSGLALSFDSQVTSVKVEECDQYTGLIVGGTKAKIGEFPHMAAVGFRTSSGIAYNCGGTLISDQFVMTAAHCTHSSLGNPIVVRLGDLNLSSDDDEAEPREYSIIDVIVHNDYKPPDVYNDIALLKLGRKVLFDKNVRPACLYNQIPQDGEQAIVTGWGATNYGDLPSNDLLKVSLDIIENRRCSQLYGYDSKVKHGIVNSMVCAGKLEGGKDTCQGDSGGPMEIARPAKKCMHYVVGVTSFGRVCGSPSPSVYTRVSYFIPWIESIVWGNGRPVTLSSYTHRNHNIHSVRDHHPRALVL